jgi:delta14-sterol reductase
MTDLVIGFFAPWLVYLAILLLHLALPAQRISGYVLNRKTGKPLTYRLNGLTVLLVCIGIWAVLGQAGVLPWDWLYHHRWSGIAGACTLGLIISFAVVVTAPGSGKPFIKEFFLGRLENPQFLKAPVDAKMYLYMAGATMLALNILSFFSYHRLTYGSEIFSGPGLYTLLFLWFITEYMFFERVHLYTYDLFAENVGFKLVWGCLTFYPYVYMTGLWATAALPDPKLPVWQLILFTCLFFTGWIFARGANMQKYLFKRDPAAAFLGIIKPATISDGKHSLLCSGFWGISRHANYLGEILMATGLTLALGRPGIWMVWIYPLYYIFLLVPRQRDDERRCAAKYGSLWHEYVRRVPRRIIPGIY